MNSDTNSSSWILSAAGSILITIFGYILFNIAVIVSGKAYINLGLLAIGAGCLTSIVFYKRMKSTPMWGVVLTGIVGVFGIQFGLKWTHESLLDPASTMEIIYDLVVLTSVGLWIIVEKPLKLQKTKIVMFDVYLHLVMAGLVTIRLWLHWDAGWSIESFQWVLLSIVGYWLFNISMRMSETVPEKATPTKAIMNILYGLLLVGYALLFGEDGVTQVNWGTLIGTIGIFFVIYFIGKSYKILGARGHAPMVITLVYDGLLIFAPICLYFVFPGKSPLVWGDLFITLGFIAVMSLRIYLHVKQKK